MLHAFTIILVDYPYLLGILHLHWDNHTIAPVPMKQPWIHFTLITWRWWYNHNKTKHNTTMCIFHGIYCHIHRCTTLLAICKTWQWVCHILVQPLIHAFPCQVKKGNTILLGTSSVLCQCHMSCHLEFAMRASPTRICRHQEKIFIWKTLCME